MCARAFPAAAGPELSLNHDPHGWQGARGATLPHTPSCQQNRRRCSRGPGDPPGQRGPGGDSPLLCSPSTGDLTRSSFRKAEQVSGGHGPEAETPVNLCTCPAHPSEWEFLGQGSPCRAWGELFFLWSIHPLTQNCPRRWRPLEPDPPGSACLPAEKPQGGLLPLSRGRRKWSSCIPRTFTVDWAHAPTWAWASVTAVGLRKTQASAGTVFCLVTHQPSISLLLAFLTPSNVCPFTSRPPAPRPGSLTVCPRHGCDNSSQAWGLPRGVPPTPGSGPSPHPLSRSDRAKHRTGGGAEPVLRGPAYPQDAGSRR